MAPGSSAIECYKGIEDCTLNGMPCDGVIVVTDKGENHFSWKQKIDVHGAYWVQAGGNAENYYMLRNQLIAGILAKTDYTLAVANSSKYSRCRA